MAIGRNTDWPKSLIERKEQEECHSFPCMACVVHFGTAGTIRAFHDIG
jgi:hypothetical protein